MKPQEPMNCTPREMPQTQYLGEVPQDNLPSLPDYILASRLYTDPTTGNQLNTLTRIPTARLVPNGSYDNVSVIEGNNPSIEVVEGQVLAAYIKNEGSRFVVHLADRQNPAQFLIVGKLPNGQLLIQPCGVVSIPGTHQYVVGQTYYTSNTNAGEPVTNSATGQKLFVPISDTQLLVKMG